MANTIKIPMSGKAIDHDLKAIVDAENQKNNDKVVYIRHGELAFDTYENLFNIVQLT